MSKLTELLDELCPDGVEYRPLGEVGEFLRGSSLQKKHLTSEGVPCIHYGQVYTRYGLSANETYSFLKPEFATGKRTMTTGDLFIATTSENEEDLGKAVAWLGQKEVVASNDAFIYRHNLDPMYVSYFFASSYFHDQKYRFITGTKVKRLSGDSMAKIIIPVPPLEVQQEIVRVLDAFTDLEQSLVSELELRKKQLVAQRERLLGGGTEFSTLGENFLMKAGKFVKASEIAQNPSDENPYPCYGANGLRGYVSHMTHEGDYVLVGRQGALSGNTVRVSGCFAATEHAVVVSPLELDDFDLDWIYHKLTAMNLNQYVTRGAQPGLSVRTLQRVPISIDTPSLQRSVAEKLGLFESLIQSIEQEISLRRQQYEFYRDELLSFAPKED